MTKRELLRRIEEALDSIRRDSDYAANNQRGFTERAELVKAAFWEGMWAGLENARGRIPHPAR